MADEIEASEVAAAARLAGVHLSERELEVAVRQLPGFLAVVRGLPCPPEIEPLPVFIPREGK